MKLSNRLETIGRLVPQNSIVADIGTDHGYIPAYLIKNKISKKVIGTDISKGSLDKIIQYIKDLDYEEYVDSRLGNGLEVIRPYEVDTVIIAGMGGVLISDILDKDREVADSISNFILQPMIGAEELRKYLMENNFKIIKEELAKDEHRYYEIIFAKKGKGYIEKDINFQIARELIDDKHPLLPGFIESKIQLAEKIIESLDGQETEKARERYEELKKSIDDYKEVAGEIEG